MDVSDILEKFDIKPNNEELFKTAFIHSSYAVVNGLNHDYERLEFLGDSVLSMIVSDYLQQIHLDYGEGKLTKIRSNYVCQSALEVYSRELGLSDCIKVNLEDTNITDNEILSISADVFESFLGAIYIDQGIDKAREFLKNNIFPYIDSKVIFFYDYKSQIKEYGDAKDIDIHYELVSEYGAPHDKTFIMSIIIDGINYGTGVGKSKKDAEQIAARKAIEDLGL
ncbi:MAG: ribonuclease III [Methanobacteriaceae archaeon]|nr:ribonuclease III [Methanobacteriaceae archaeon]